MKEFTGTLPILPKPDNEQTYTILKQQVGGAEIEKILGAGSVVNLLINGSPETNGVPIANITFTEAVPYQSDQTVGIQMALDDNGFTAYPIVSKRSQQLLGAEWGDNPETRWNKMLISNPKIAGVIGLLANKDSQTVGRLMSAIDQTNEAYVQRLVIKSGMLSQE